VIAHCLGHGYVFENNAWLGAVDRDIMSRVVSAAERIADYMGAHGRDRVEDFIDACQAIAVHQPQAQLIRKAPVSAPEESMGPYDALFPAEVAAQRAQAEATRQALRTRFPREPEEDLLGFIERHAHGLEDWQRDIMSIVASEQSYFLPQLRTKIINEGAAVLVHQEICQRMFLSADRYWEYERLNAGVVAPHPGRVNPYNVGVTLLREIMRIAAEPDDEERDRWSWAGHADPLAQVRLVLGSYDDEALLREFLTPKVCELARLYAFEHLPQDPRRIRARGRRRPRGPDPPALDVRHPPDRHRRRRLPRPRRAADRASPRWHRPRRGVCPRHAHPDRAAVGQALHGAHGRGHRRRHAAVDHRPLRRPLRATLGRARRLTRRPGPRRARVTSGTAPA
jgi:spore cortex formation protein SpoVR/YcgB (stage V sporulation)